MYSSFIISGATVLACISIASGAMLDSRESSDSLAGQATFYGGNLHGGACSFSTYTLPSGIFGTALSDANWDDAANCGACIKVSGPGGKTITAMIVDECPGCGTNHLDLFPDAFAVFAPPSTGVIGTSFTYIPCPITSPLELHNKEGVSQYWFSMQVVNANKAVSTLEVSTDGGNTWQSTERQSYNFFEQSSGFGTNVVDVQLTSVDGDVLIVKGVRVSSGASMTAAENFGDSAPVLPAKSDNPPATSSTAAPVVPISKPTAPAFPLQPLTSSVAPPEPPTSKPGAVFVTSVLPIVTDTTSNLVSTDTCTPGTVETFSTATTAAPISSFTTVAVPVPVVTVTVYSNEGCET